MKPLSLRFYKTVIPAAFVVGLAMFTTCNKPKTSTQSIKKDTTSKIDEVKVPETPVVPQLSESDSLDLKIGQMIMMGINDAKTISPKDSVVSDLRANRLGGIILFEKNIQATNSFKALKSCIDSLQKYAKIPLFISIDEEGGKVHRLKEKYGFVKMPSAMYLGKIDNADSTLFYNNQLAKELFDLGINMNYAPSLDLGVNKNNPVIYKLWRSFSGDPTIVTKHAQLAIEAHQAHKICTVIKHFPGHGSSQTDSHLGLTDVTKTWNKIELGPFANIITSGKCDAVMTAHIVNCKLDSSCLPATLSKKIINDLLRQELGYDGVIISDDMQMHAISKNYGFQNAVNLSINAGVDILLLGNNVIASQKVSPEELHATIKKLIRDGKISKQRIDQSYRRIMKLKLKYL